MKRSFALPAFATFVALVTMPIAAQAAPHHHPHSSLTSRGPSSYADMDNNGRWTSGDKKLPPPMAHGVEYATYTAPDTRDGVVLGGSLPPMVFVSANGDIHVDGSISGEYIELSSLDGDIWIAPGVRVGASQYGLQLNAPHGTIHLGDGARLSGGSGTGVDVRAHTIDEGNNVALNATGIGGHVELMGAPTFGTGDSFLTAAGGVSQDTEVLIATCGNIDLDHASFAGEDIRLDARASCAEGGHVSLTNSKVTLDRDENSSFDTIGSPVDLTGTTFSPKDAHVGTL